MTGTPGDQGKDLAAWEMDLGNKNPGSKAGSGDWMAIAFRNAWNHRSCSGCPRRTTLHLSSTRGCLEPPP